MSKVGVQLDAIGHGRVVVDGLNLAGSVRATTIRAEAGQATRVTLEHEAVDIDFELNAEVDHEVFIPTIGWGRGATLRDALTDLISQIDAPQEA